MSTRGQEIIGNTIAGLPDKARWRVSACIIGLAADTFGWLREPSMQELLRGLVHGRGSLAIERSKYVIESLRLAAEDQPFVKDLIAVLEDARYGTYIELAESTSRLLKNHRKAGSIDEAEQMVGRCLVEGKNPTTDKRVERGFIRLLWADYWASERERAGGRFQPGENIYDTAPAVPRRAAVVARELLEDVKKAGGKSLSELYLEAMGDRPGEHRKYDTPEAFGNSLAFMTTGAGVSWSDDHPSLDWKVPYREFYL